MSRFGKILVTIPTGVNITLDGRVVKVKGPKGEISLNVPRAVNVKVDGTNVAVEIKEKSKFGISLQGTIRSHIVNMIQGVTTGWKKSLELVGTGYRAEVKGTDLVLTLGYSHPIIIKAPVGIKFSVEKLVVHVEGANKDVVGLIAAKVRESRVPDAYKGKGVRYLGEILKLKPGKQAAKTTGAA